MICTLSAQVNSSDSMMMIERLYEVLVKIDLVTWYIKMLVVGKLAELHVYRAMRTLVTQSGRVGSIPPALPPVYANRYIHRLTKI